MTGNVWLDQTDASVPGVLTKLRLTRSYNSALAATPGREFGRGWSHGYANQITHPSDPAAPNPMSYLSLRLGDGRPLYFAEDPQVSLTFVPLLPLTEQSYVVQSATTPTTYTRRFPDGSEEVYDAVGRLISIADTLGVTTELRYDPSTGRLDTISDAIGGRTLILGYPNLTATLADKLSVAQTLGGPATLIATYSYTHGVFDDLLTGVEYADGDGDTQPDGGFTFVYDDPNYPYVLSEVKDREGTVLERHAYDLATGKGSTSEVGPPSAPSEKYTLQYLPGGLTKVTDGRGNVTEYRHGSVAGIERVWRIQGPCAACPGGGHQTQEWEYDTQGRIKAYKDGMGVVTDYTYVISGLDTETRRPSPSTTHVTGYTYHPDGRLYTKTDPNGAVTTILYVPAGPELITEMITPTEFKSTRISYTPQGKPHLITDPRDKIWELHFNGVGDLDWMKDPLGHQTTYQYDPMGRLRQTIPPTTVPLPPIQTPTTTYDTLGRVKKITNSDDGTYTEFTYDGGGRRKKLRDVLGRITDYGYDLHGRLETVTQRGPFPAEDIVTTYGYDVMSNLASITDARSKTTTFDHDGFNRVRSIIPPGPAVGTIEEFTYDNAGRLATRKNRKGVTTTFVYDGLGRLTDKTFSSGAPSVSFRYDEDAGHKGRLTSAWRGTPPGSMLRWSYDLAGQVRTESSTRTTGTAVVGYDYDKAGNRRELFLDQQSRITYTYDDRGLPEFIRRVLPNPPATQDFHIVFDDAGRRQKLEYQNGIDTDYWYDQRSRLTRIKTEGNAVVTDITYPLYDAADNRKERAGTGAPAESYLYDHFYRLDIVTRPPDPTEDYGYDRVGNRIASLALPTWNYNDRNQLVSNNDASFTYDLNGNLATKTENGANWTYEWDEEDRLKRVTLNGAQVVAYVYDALGRRIERLLAGPVLHSYVYDGEDILKQDFTSLLEEPGMLDPPPHFYVHGPGIDEPLAVVHGNDSVWNYHADGLGSIIAVTDNATQQLAFARQYDTFGRPEQGADEEGYAYTGREWEPETGLYYYRARYYDPKIGRFISEDPIGFDGGINFYAYVENNPQTSRTHLALNLVPSTDGSGVLATRAAIHHRHRPSSAAHWNRNGSAGPSGNDSGHV